MEVETPFNEQGKEMEASCFQEKPLSQSLIRYLYIAQFLARWDVRMWEFSVGVYMITLWPNSLTFAAIYGAVESASSALFGPVVGQWAQKLSYVKVLRIWLVTQNLSFMLAGCSVITLLYFSTLKSTNFTAFIFLVILTNIAGAVGVLSTVAGTILIERECCCWFHYSFISVKASAMALAIWNSSAVLLEYWLFISVYEGIPALGENGRNQAAELSPTCNSEKGKAVCKQPEDSHPGNVVNTELEEKGWIRRISKRVSKAPFVLAWKVYLREDVVLPGVSLALLYFTVLSFGTLMTATLKWEGVPAFVIAIARGISAIIGIGATVVYPILHSRISTLKTGLWSIWSQWTCLLICIGSIWVKNHHLAAYMLMAGVATSRLGLWMFDLSVTQQMQDHVPESDRCIVGGVQNSLQSILDLCSYLMGIFISNPADFWQLSVSSFGAVTFAAILYSGHLLPTSGQQVSSS